MYNLLFQAAWETLAQFAYTKLQSETGMIAVLHTWGQNLSLHPHLHCVVPGGGINYQNRWTQVKVSANGKVFLFPVKNISVVFRAKFIAALQKTLLQEKTFVRQLYKHNWVVYAKEPFAGPQQLIDYLGRYTHKVAIGNHRLISVNEEGVRFRYHDYRDGKDKTMMLTGTEFLRRFCMHILPKGFVRIRYYGFLASSKREQFRQIQIALGGQPSPKREKKNWKQLCCEKLNYNPAVCPQCSAGKMLAIASWERGRAPPPIVLIQHAAKHNKTNG